MSAGSRWGCLLRVPAKPWRFHLCTIDTNPNRPSIYGSIRHCYASLRECKIVTLAGGVWHATTVIRVQKRLGLG
jgi:hypothetical protein